MRTFRYWAKLERDLEIDGVVQRTRVVAGSGHSVEDARREAERRLEWIRARIHGHGTPDDTYEADIRETVLESPSRTAAITRNRYGAHVLNCADLPILDVDEPPSGFWDLFARHTPEWRLERMRKVLGDLSRRYRDQGIGFRFYTTAKGFRVILVGQPMEPRDARMKALVKALHVDPLYWTLCRKQGCYRARLTPKPHRMKAPTIRVPFPPTPEQAARIAEWEQGYLEHARTFATCRFLQAFGPDASHPLVTLHDARTGAQSERCLA